MNFVHAGPASIGREAHVAVLGAAEEHTEKLVQMSKQEAGSVLAILRPSRDEGCLVLLVGGSVLGWSIHL